MGNLLLGTRRAFVLAILAVACAPTLQQQREESERASGVLNSLASVFGKQAGVATATAPPKIAVSVAGQASPKKVATVAGKPGGSTGSKTQAADNDDELDAAINKALDFG